MSRTIVRAKYEDGVLKPLETLDLRDGEIVEIEVRVNPVDRLAGLIRIDDEKILDEIIESSDLEYDDELDEYLEDCSRNRKAV